MAFGTYTGTGIMFGTEYRGKKRYVACGDLTYHSVTRATTIEGLKVLNISLVGLSHPFTPSRNFWPSASSHSPQSALR